MSRLVDTMRSLVNSTVESSGVFSDEMMRVFFAEMKDAVNATFFAIYEEIEKTTGKSNAWKMHAFQRALQYLADEDNEKDILKHIRDNDDALESIQHAYYLAMSRFCVTMSCERRFVPVDAFMLRLYQKLATKPEMRKLYYTMSADERDTFLADVVRWTMQRAIVRGSHGGRVELTVPRPVFDSVSAASVVGEAVGTGLTQATLDALERVENENI